MITLRILSLPVMTGLALWCGSCVRSPAYVQSECPIFSDLGTLRVNPAGALDRHLRVGVTFKVCPPEEGLAELRRKRIELKHRLIAWLSAKTAVELEDPLRVERLQAELLSMVNEEVVKKSLVVNVFISEFELE